MKLSIVIPAFNAADHLATCLESVIHQVGWRVNQEYEVIVVDDGSTDRTAAIAQQFPVTLISLPANQGRIAARQAGAKRAQAEQLLFVDTRVVIATNYLVTLARYLTQYPCVLAGNQSVSEQKFHWSRVFNLIRQKWYGHQWWPAPRVSHWITPQNFIRSPKGLGVMSLPKQLFLLIQPPHPSTWQNDDTQLLETLVFEYQQPILRAADLTWRYTFRPSWEEIAKWLLDRGTYFASYYLQPQHRFFCPLLVLGAITLGLAGLVWWLEGLSGVLWLALIAVAGVSAWLAQQPADLLSLGVFLPLTVLTFSLGVVRYWWQQLAASFPQERLRPFVLGVLLTAFALVFYHHRQAFLLLTSFAWQNVLVLISLYGLFYLLNGLFLRQVLQAYQVRVTPWRATAISTLSTAGNTFLPARGGAVWRAAYLRSAYSFSLADFMATLTAGYFITFHVNAAVTLIALLLLDFGGSFPPWPLFSLFFTIWLISGLSMLFPALGQHQANILPAKVSRAFQGWQTLMKNRSVVIQLLTISTANVFISAALLWSEYRALQLPNITLFQTTILSSTASLGLFFSLTPAALGIREGLLIITANLLQLEPTQALAVGLLDRGLNLGALLLLVGPSLWLIQRKQ